MKFSYSSFFAAAAVAAVGVLLGKDKLRINIL
jgi:hypothetical protein